MKSNSINFLYAFIVLSLLASCESLLDVEDPKSRISKDVVFNDDAVATSAVTGMYLEMFSVNNLLSGSPSSIVSLSSLSADDFDNYWQESVMEQQFFENDISPQNDLILGLWTSAYRLNYQANAIIEALEKSNNLTPSVRDQLKGEALLVRGFVHFNLVNLFGPVPLITSTDYNINTRASRNSVDDVYNQVILDLKESQTLMSETYPSENRVRPNRSTATALLARVYLFNKNWSDAELQATQVINDGRYEILNDLNQVFLSTSAETIWSLMPIRSDINTHEGYNFIVDYEPWYYELSDDFVNSFENNDARLQNWVGSFDSGIDIFYFPFKYKIKYGGPTSSPPIDVTEYSILFRLAEQFLIRAEARAELDRLDEAISDLDVIRERAQLPLIQNIEPGISKGNLLLTIERERRSELFTEWGHRWFDLKRKDRATLILAPKKADWQSTDELYPLPDIEFSRNPNLKDQNPGY